MNSAGAGALASAMLSAAVAGRADPTRFGRGRTYVREGAVVDLQIRPGELTAAVIGSRSTPYRVTVRVPGVHDAGGALDTADVRRLNLLVPHADDLRCSCTCPDGPADPCKHAVAALLAFTQQVAIRPELLADWRSGPPGSRTAGPASTSTAPRADRPPSAPLPVPLSPAEAAFLGDPDVVLPGLPELEALPIGSSRVGSVDLGEVVADALDLIRATYHDPGGRR